MPVYFYRRNDHSIIFYLFLLQKDQWCVLFLPHQKTALDLTMPACYAKPIPIDPTKVDCVCVFVCVCVCVRERERERDDDNDDYATCMFSTYCGALIIFVIVKFVAVNAVDTLQNYMYLS